MYSINSFIVIEDIVKFSPGADSTDFVDKTETKFTIRSKDVVKLYEGLKHSMEKSGFNFEEYCDKLFE